LKILEIGPLRGGDPFRGQGDRQHVQGRNIDDQPSDGSGPRAGARGPPCLRHRGLATLDVQSSLLPRAASCREHFGKRVRSLTIRNRVRCGAKIIKQEVWMKRVLIGILAVGAVLVLAGVSLAAAAPGASAATPAVKQVKKDDGAVQVARRWRCRVRYMRRYRTRRCRPGAPVRLRHFRCRCPQRPGCPTLRRPYGTRVLRCPRRGYIRYAQRWCKCYRTGYIGRCREVSRWVRRVRRCRPYQRYVRYRNYYKVCRWRGHRCRAVRRYSRIGRAPCRGHRGRRFARFRQRISTCRGYRR
jgi:hypothetical protein